LFRTVSILNYDLYIHIVGQVAQSV